MEPREREEGQEPGERPARQNYNPIPQKLPKSTGAMIEDEVPF